MPLLSCRKTLSSRSQIRNSAANAGLVLSRYLRSAVPADEGVVEPAKGTQVFVDIDHQDERRQLFKAAQSACAAAHGLYAKALSRRKDMADRSGWRQFELDTEGLMAIGLGSASAFEVGLTLNHVYGVPMIPGSSLKGVAAHYCDNIWGRVEEGYKRSGAYHKIIFGTAEPDDEVAGAIKFEDAWIDADSLRGALQFDVMTPHHNKYYMPSNPAQPEPPADWDSPIPIQFLSVRGRFHICLGFNVNDPGAANAKLCMDRSEELVREALKHWGLGGKISSGYGRMS